MPMMSGAGPSLFSEGQGSFRFSGRRKPNMGQEAQGSLSWMVLVLTVGLVVAGCRELVSREVAPIPVRVETVREASVEDGQRGAAYLATVKGRDQVTLSFKVGGIVERVGPESGLEDWQEGATFTHLQLLAELHPNDFLAASNSAAAQAQLDRTQYERAQAVRPASCGSGRTSQQANTKESPRWVLHLNCRVTRRTGSMSQTVSPSRQDLGDPRPSWRRRSTFAKHRR